MKSVTVNVLDPRSWENAQADLLTYLSDLEQKARTICERLATIGAVRASLDFSRAIYSGPNDVAVSVEPTSNGYAIHARGNAVLFIEFGSGATYGYGHPEPGEYGPGTYNMDSPNWRNPKGWWYGDSQHTYGNPPAQAMYNAKQEILNMVEQVAREVFSQ